MKNKIEDLRNHLFATIEGLRDGSMDIDKARAIAQVADTIIESAKVEVQFLNAIGGDGTGFVPVKQEERSRLQLVGSTRSRK